MNDADLVEPGWNARFVAVGDIRLHVVEAGDPVGPPLLLLHGFPEFWWGWRKQIRALTEAGFRIIMPDMRGYNLSDAPQDARDYGLDVLARDVVGLATAMGCECFNLVGHDWGGVVAWQVAGRHPERVRRLIVLDAPHPNAWSAGLLKHPMQAVRSSYVLFFQLPRIPEIMLGVDDFARLRAMLRRSARDDAFEPDALDRCAKAWQRPGRFTAMLNYYRALRRTPRHLSARVQASTLILWGGRDRFLGRHMAEESLTWCDEARLEVVEDATHWLHLEEPDRVSNAIIGHLKTRR